LKLIVGFGNPGEKFVNNRQNIGFKVVEILANNENIDVRVKKKKSVIGRGSVNGTEVVLLKPQTFVNLIGESVLYIASFLRINVREIICVLEDPTLPVGELRVDYRLSKIKHEGIESITKALKSDKFAKVRVGVGVPPKSMTVEQYLLTDFTDRENLILIDVLNKAEEAVKALITNTIESVQENYNPEGPVRIERRRVRKVYVKR